MKENQMKEMAWNTFKKTGNIDTFLELVELQNTLEKNEVKNIEGIQYGNYQNKGNYPFGK